MTMELHETLSDPTKYTAMEVKVSDLEVDPEVQRTSLNEAKVRRIMGGYDRNAVGVVTVSCRTNGAMIVLDGMHRVEAVRRLTNGEGELPCHVFEGLSPQEEARIFLLLNAGDKPGPFDQWRIMLRAGDETAQGVQRIVRHHGYAVSMSSGDGSIGAIKVLQNLYDHSVEEGIEPNLLHTALKIISAAWGDDKNGLQGALIMGLGRWVGEYGERANLDNLIDRLRKYKGGPAALLAAAKQQGDIRRVKNAVAVADIITDEYNKSVRGARNQLPRWSKKF